MEETDEIWLESVNYCGAKKESEQKSKQQAKKCRPEKFLTPQTAKYLIKPWRELIGVPIIFYFEETRLDFFLLKNASG